HRFCRDVEGYNCGLDIWRHSMIEIIAVHADIQLTNRHRVSPNRPKKIPQPFRQGHASLLNPHQDNLPAGFISLGNLVSNSRQSTLNCHIIEDNARFRHESAGKSSTSLDDFRMIEGIPT